MREGHFDTARPLLGPASELARLDPANAAEVLFLCAALFQAQGEGSTRLDLTGEPFERRLTALGATAAEVEGARALTALSRPSPSIGAPGERRPLIVEGAHLYFERVLRLEEALAQHLGARLTPDADARLRTTLPAVPPLPDRHQLNEAQREAVARVLAAVQRGQGGLVLITGGPGTGKTFVVASLLRALARTLVPARDAARLPTDTALAGPAALFAAPRRAGEEGDLACTVRFAAPTGKAADRMGQSIQQALTRGIEASAEGSDERAIDQALLEGVRREVARPRTLHSLLGYQPRRGTFRFHAKNPLPLKLLVVDEASMIDLSMMRRVLAALPQGAVLVLLGDADQLPSVDAGAVLRDLVSSDDPRLGQALVRLTQSHRQRQSDPDGAAILGAAQAVNAGEPPEAPLIVTRESAAAIEFRGVEHLEGALPELLERWFESSFEDLDGRDGRDRDFASLVRREYRLTARDGAAARFREEDAVRLGALFASSQRRKILCATRAQVEALNRWFHERHAGEVRLFGEQRAASAFERAFVPGEPLMMCRNDGARGLFNGDQGLVLRVAEPQRAQSFQAVFPGGAAGFRAFPLHELRDDLVHAFAMTVHKSQGSEYERVLLALPREDTPLLTREILYTALTRAQKSVVIQGARELFALGTRRRVERSTGLAQKIADLCPA